MGKPERLLPARNAPECITIAVPEDILARMRAAVAAGEYVTEGEIVREALRDWNEGEDRREAALAKLRAMIEEARQGPSYDGPTVMAELRSYVAERAAEEMAKRENL